MTRTALKSEKSHAIVFFQMERKPEMKLIVARFEKWASATCPREQYFAFRISFALIWLVYDVLDLCFHGNLAMFWQAAMPFVQTPLSVILVVLIACDLGLLIGWHARWFAVGAFLARAAQVFFIPLNDFYYVAITVLILSMARCGTSRNEMAEPIVPSWPRDLLVLQAAWMYFSTAFMKLSPAFLSGGDLYVRQNYIAANLPWPYPAFYRTWIASLFTNSVLAWLAVILEFSMAAFLVLWFLKPEKRGKWHRAASVLALMIHGFGAAALNVFFFGASCLAQIYCLTRSTRGTRKIGQS